MARVATSVCCNGPITMARDGEELWEVCLGCKQPIEKIDLDMLIDRGGDLESYPTVEEVQDEDYRTLEER